MKTLAELNSKWYWRLVKVIWVVLTLLILGASAVGFYEYTKTYEPADIKKVSNEINERYGSYKKLGDSIGSLSGSYQAKELRRITYIRNGEYAISNGTILYILAHNQKAQIEGVLYLDNKDNDYFHRCPTDSCTYYSDDLSDDLSEYIQSGSTLYITQDDVNKFSAYEKDLIALNSEFTKFESGDISFENISLSWKKFFGKDDYFYESYRGLTEWIKIICSTIAIFIGMIVFTVIMKGIFYYIVLGKFNPEK